MTMSDDSLPVQIGLFRLTLAPPDLARRRRGTEPGRLKFGIGTKSARRRRTMCHLF